MSRDRLVKGLEELNLLFIREKPIEQIEMLPSRLTLVTSHDKDNKKQAWSGEIHNSPLLNNETIQAKSSG